MTENRERAAGDLPDRAFSTFLTNTTDIMYVLDRNMAVLSASDSFVRYLGLSDASAVIGSSIFDILPDKEQAKRYARDARVVLKTGEDILGFVESVHDHEGRIHHALCSKYAVRDEAGLPAAVLFVSRDMTREYETNEDYWRSVQYLLELRDNEYAAWMFDVTS